MKHTIFTLLILLITPNVFATENTPIKAVNNLFDAMRQHDGNKLLAQFTQDAQLERVTIDNVVTRSELPKFAHFVGTSEKYLDEKLLSISIHVSDNLASIWTPYAFYIDGKLSHCGVNSFQLIHTDKQWKIQYLIDNTHSGDCNTFINKHKKTSA
ncbi:hypothetical protein Q4489_17840 [Thalassotalea sp. 1_MG-2023]|uniref:hypothetical protein n=1 Tax=Thalassotalea sp. 1_MG-2023 TaxID=3062680 RepID=UPI0026E2D04C|nr:hypothetical protein [Thalassotalea sp. 1_MG-2023]MDO6428871.1 hypothetical protein [Thalassotalea sp. 1_MG-2023]